MSIASATSKSGPYACNGATTLFAVAFACFAAADLYVVRTDTSGVDTTLTLGTDYAVALNADQTNSPGGNVTLVAAPAAGFLITVLRNVALTQGTQLPNQGGWYPQVVEKAFDKLTMIVQQVSEKVSRSVVVGVTAGDPSTLIAAINGAGASAISAGASATSAANSATSAGNSATAAAASAASINLPAPNATVTPAVLRSMNGVSTYGEPGIKGADIASAATINLTTSTGNLVHVTGTTAITAITIPIGAERTVIFDGVLTLTHGAALLLPGAANITTAAGDRMVVRGDTTGANVISYTGAPATAAEIRTGTATNKNLTPASTLSAIGFSAYTQTADQTITTNGALTIAHGLGRVPVLMMAFVKNFTAEFGFSVGDIAQIPIGGFMYDGGSGYAGVTLTADATNIYVRFSNDATVFLLIHKTLSTPSVLTNASWKFFVRALA